VAICVLGAFALAQETGSSGKSDKTASDTDIQLLRSDLQAGKEKVIADTMQFTDAEASAFWPVYREYAYNQQAIGDERIALIKSYLKGYDTLDNNTAKSMVEQMNEVDRELLSLREDFWPKFSKAVGAKRAAKFYQVDNRLNLLINTQLSANIPLIP
jgi:hypothetical protein